MAADIFVRNCREVPQSNNQSGATVFNLRELFLLAGYTENSNDGDAAWTGSSVVATPSDCAVGAVPRQITSPSGPFTQAMVDDEHVISLLATNKQNRVKARIVEFIDADTIKIDSMSWNDVVGWETESGIPARVTRATSQIVANGAWTLLDAPGGSNMQVRLESAAVNYMYVHVRPNGQAGDPREMGGYQLYGTYTWQDHFNMSAKDHDVLIWGMRNYNGTLYCHVLGVCELGLAGSDPGPAMLVGGYIESVYAWELSYWMLGATGVSMSVYPGIWKYYGDQDSSDCLTRNNPKYQLVNGNPGVVGAYAPWVHGPDWPNEAFRRGRVPADFLRFTHATLGALSPFDPDGEWMHTYGGLAVPRNGHGDPRIIPPI